MRKVDRPCGRPGHCALIPGRAQDPEGFVATGVILPGWDPEVVVSATGVREVAKVFGYPTPEDVAVLVAERDELLKAVEELSAEVESLREFEQAATYSLEHLGSKVRKKPGRKAQDKQPAAA